MTKETSIAYKDLREYLAAADKLGELRRVNGADWDLELGAITEVAALATRCDPATAINVINEAWSTPLDPRGAELYQFRRDHQRLPAVSLEGSVRQDLLLSSGDPTTGGGEVERSAQVGLGEEP